MSDILPMRAEADAYVLDIAWVRRSFDRAAGTYDAAARSKPTAETSATTRAAG